MSSTEPPTSYGQLAKMADGDSIAWECFVERWSAKILAWCLSSGLSRHDADEVHQGVLTKLFQKLHLYTKDEGPFRKWFCRVAFNTIKDFMRGKARNRDVTGSAAGAVLEAQSASVEPDPTELAENMADTEAKLKEIERRVKESGISDRDWWIYVERVRGISRKEVSKKHGGLAVQTVSNICDRVDEVVKEVVKKLQQDDDSP